MLTLKSRIRPRVHLAAVLIASSLTVLMVCAAARAAGNEAPGNAADNEAAGSQVGGCVGSWDTFNCVWRWGANRDPYVRQIPEPASDADKGISTEREHRWEQRCRPQIAVDRYGVGRYVYSEPGCEFGAY